MQSAFTVNDFNRNRQLEKMHCEARSEFTRGSNLEKLQRQDGITGGFPHIIWEYWRTHPLAERTAK